MMEVRLNERGRKMVEKGVKGGKWFECYMENKEIVSNNNENEGKMEENLIKGENMAEDENDGKTVEISNYIKMFVLKKEGVVVGMEKVNICEVFKKYEEVRLIGKCWYRRKEWNVYREIDRIMMEDAA